MDKTLSTDVQMQFMRPGRLESARKLGNCLARCRKTNDLLTLKE